MIRAVIYVGNTLIQPTTFYANVQRLSRREVNAWATTYLNLVQLKRYTPGTSSTTFVVLEGSIRNTECSFWQSFYMGGTMGPYVAYVRVTQSNLGDTLFNNNNSKMYVFKLT